MQGRGKKENNNKNWKNNEDFQKGKKIGRPKQVFVSEDEDPSMAGVLGQLGEFKGGRWDKVGQ